MATVTITHEIVDVSGDDDNSEWVFSSDLRVTDDGSSIVTPKAKHVLPVEGLLTVKLEPGPVKVKHNGVSYDFTAPDHDSDLWPLIAPAVGIPPSTASDAIVAAVAAYLQANPDSGSGSGSGIAALVDDPAPQLSADLDLNGHSAGSASAADLAKLHGAGTLSGNNTGDQDLSSFATTTALAANSTADRNRANHTGQQPVSSLSDFTSSVNALISLVVAGAPGALDTLDELAAAFGDDPNFAATMATALGNKQPLAANLTTLAALAATTDSFIQAKSGAFAMRTIAQVKADLGLSGTNSGDQTLPTALTQLDTTVTGAQLNSLKTKVDAIAKVDVGLGNVDNTSDATKNSATAALTNKDLASSTNTFPAHMLAASALVQNNWLAWSFDQASTSGQTAPTTGLVNLVKIPWPVTQTVTNVICANGNGGTTLTSGQNFVGLYYANGTQIGVSADQTSAWSGSNGLKTAALVGGPVTVTSTGPTGFIYAALLSNAATAPQFFRATATTNTIINGGLAAGSYRACTVPGGTTLPSSITPSGSTSTGLYLFMAVS